VPPPRFPLLRMTGVLAPSSTWRRGEVARGDIDNATNPESRTGLSCSSGRLT
jgi:hypothetical protein